MKKSLSILILILMLCLPLLAQKQMTVADFEQEVWRLTNEERARHGLPGLYYESGLAALAKRHSANMLQRGFFAHRDPWGDEVSGRKDKYYPNLLVSSIGENLGKFTNSQKVFVPQELVTGWMNSPTHRANILDQGYTHIGIGIVFRNDEMYATQNFATPIVKLISEIPQRMTTKNPYRLRFEYMALASSTNFNAMLIFPRKDIAIKISDNQEMVGAQPLPIKWLNERSFEVEVPFVAGKGDYKLCFGYGGGYFPEGILLKVK